MDLCTIIGPSCWFECVVVAVVDVENLLLLLLLLLLLVVVVVVVVFVITFMQDVYNSVPATYNVC